MRPTIVNGLPSIDVNLLTWLNPTLISFPLDVDLEYYFEGKEPLLCYVDGALDYFKLLINAWIDE